MKEKMIAYLQMLMDAWQEEKAKYGNDDRLVHQHMLDMIACKEMAECLIGEPVNLQLDGKVTTGFPEF